MIYKKSEGIRMIMKIIVDKLPEKSNDCLFCSIKEDTVNCMIGTKFESINEHKAYCSCSLNSGEKCPYLEEL